MPLARRVGLVLLALIAGLAALATRAGAAPGPDRLINLSSRAAVGKGDQVVIAGFVVADGSPKRVLLRAIGPTLQGFGVSDALLDPVLELVDSAGRTLATNDNWTADTASAFTEAGAFILSPGTKDAVIVATLPPGLYTAIVRGAGDTTGVALVEVYDLEGTSRLLNLSSRALAGPGQRILISGLVVSASSGPRRLLLRAVGPLLNDFNVPGVLADPVLTVYDEVKNVVATNDDWHRGDAAAITAATTQVGAYPLPTGSRDAALVIDLPGGAYTVHVSSTGAAEGVALLEAFDLTPSSGGAPVPTVNLAATLAATSPSTSSPATFTFSRTGDLSAPLTVTYSLAGTAVSGIDYNGLVGSVFIPAGFSSASAQLNALPSATSGSKTVLVSLRLSPTYGIGQGTAQATLYYGTGTLHFAQLRPTGTAAATSSAYGSFSLQLSADEKVAYVSLTFGGLSSPQTVAYLRLAQGSEEGVNLLRLPAGDVTSLQWQIRDTAGLTAVQIVEELKAGKVYVSVETTMHPTGELRGALIRGAGSQEFTPPPAPTALVSDWPTPVEAARFLTQATFGPTPEQIDALTTKGYAAWLQEQMTLPASSHRAATVDDYNTTNTNPSTTRPNGGHRQTAWWKIVVTGQDQLRQRVAFALSEIFVISDVNGTINNWQEGAAHYTDLLAANAFGNFRTLLEDVTLSPMMGVYLSHIRNGKATATTQPDENFAREVMQLFTIGLQQLQPDGRLKLDAAGRPQPTYDQRTITEMARVFTGWQFAQANPTATNFRAGGNVITHYVQPMTLNPFFHDDGEKVIIGGVVLPANQGGAKDLAATLDALVEHPNTGPFICRQLIQRLVTSNPSPAYVYRVAQVFARNEQGTRGDLAAVVRAILLDPEARLADEAAAAGYGKLKEPLLRVTAILRACDGGTDSGRFPIANAQNALAQAALRSPTVFNFFEPMYVVPGALASAGLYAPEFQILTDITAISVPNQLYSYITATRSSTTIGLRLTGVPSAASPDSMVDHLNLLLCAGALPEAARQRIVTALQAMPAGTSDLNRQRSAVYLVVTSPAAAVQH
jgi:uncharacterized protein (DUF1800 family)